MLPIAKHHDLVGMQYVICLAERKFFLDTEDRPALDLEPLQLHMRVSVRLSCDRVLSGGVSWILSMAPNIHRNVDGEVAYAANP